MVRAHTELTKLIRKNQCTTKFSPAEITHSVLYLLLIDGERGLIDVDSGAQTH